MRGQTCSALIFFLLLSAQSRAETACVDLAQLAHSTVSITRYFDDAERDAHAHMAGIQGTGGFSPRPRLSHRTRRHCDGLSTQDWKPLDIKGGADSQLISARIQRWVEGGMEKLAVLELQAAFPGPECRNSRGAAWRGRSCRNARIPGSKSTRC